MKVIVAFDVSMANSVVVSYDELGNCIFEDSVIHSRSGFASLNEKNKAFIHRVWYYTSICI